MYMYGVICADLIFLTGLLLLQDSPYAISFSTEKTVLVYFLVMSPLCYIGIGIINIILICIGLRDSLIKQFRLCFSHTERQVVLEQVNAESVTRDRSQLLSQRELLLSHSGERAISVELTLCPLGLKFDSSTQVCKCEHHNSEFLCSEQLGIACIEMDIGMEQLQAIEMIPITVKQNTQLKNVPTVSTIRNTSVFHKYQHQVQSLPVLVKHKMTNVQMDVVEFYV